jgi:hypothetical protein
MENVTSHAVLVDEAVKKAGLLASTSSYIWPVITSLLVIVMVVCGLCPLDPSLMTSDRMLCLYPNMP